MRLAAEYFVIDDTCTHGAASLADDDVVDGEIMRPFHSGAFDVRSGRATRFPCTDDLCVYEVALDGEKILARLGPPRP